MASGVTIGALFRLGVSIPFVRLIDENYLVDDEDFGTIIAWDSSNAGVITVLSGLVEGRHLVTFVDANGNCGTNNVTLAASGCTINKLSTNSGLNGDFGYLTIAWDGISNWMIVG